MPKDREKAINPAAAARKAEKQKAVKKGKAAITAQRNERLATRNPHRLQRQIDDLKALETSSPLSARDKKQLEDLERDLGRVKKAKEAVGDKYQKRDNTDKGGRGGGVLGKRSRDGNNDRYNHGQNRGGRHQEEDEGIVSDETDEDVRRIPMPRDTPPPIPRSSKYGNRGRGDAVGGGGGGGGGGERGAGTHANATPLGERKWGGPHGLPEKPPSPPVQQAQTVYEAKPVIRDLRREAVAFVPGAVRRNVGQGPSKGKEELGKAEEGYGNVEAEREEERREDATKGGGGEGQSGSVGTEMDVDEDMKRLQEEEERWRMEMSKQAYVEEVEDEEA